MLQVGAKLVVLNLSQQTDSSDLVGGFKPVEPRDALLPLLDTFQRLVRLTWSKGNNEDFLGRVTKYAQRQKWSSLLKAFQTAVQKAGSSSHFPFVAKLPSWLSFHTSCFATWRVLNQNMLYLYIGTGIARSCLGKHSAQAGSPPGGC